MAREPVVIDLLRTPTKLRIGDIIGVDAISAAQSRDVKNNSRTNFDVFKTASTESPRMRAMVLDVMYDSQLNDKVEKLVVLLIAPHQKGVRVENDTKNLMISQNREIKPMGLDETRNWRISYYPVVIDPQAKIMGTDADSKVIRYGSISDRTYQSVSNYVQLLEDQGIFKTYGYLTPAEQKRLSGVRNNIERAAGAVESRVGFYGNKADAQFVENMDARKAREEQEAANALRDKERAQEREEARNSLREQKSTPSGRLAYKLHMRFNETANPDLPLETANTMKLVNDDDMLVLEELGKKMKFITLRNAYDTLVEKHAESMGELSSMGACTEEESINFKATLEATLKTAVTEFYDSVHKKKPEIAEKAVPFVSSLTPTTL